MILILKQDTIPTAGIDWALADSTNTIPPLPLWQPIRMLEFKRRVKLRRKYFYCIWFSSFLRQKAFFQHFVIFKQVTKKWNIFFWKWRQHPVFVTKGEKSSFNDISLFISLHSFDFSSLFEKKLKRKLSFHNYSSYWKLMWKKPDNWN